MCRTNGESGERTPLFPRGQGHCGNWRPAGGYPGAMEILGVVLVAIGVIVALALAVSVVVLLFRDYSGWGAVLLVLFTPATLMVASLIDHSRMYGWKKTLLGFSRAEFDAMLKSPPPESNVLAGR